MPLLESPPGTPGTREVNPLLKLALELGPLLVFFFANFRYGIFNATAAFMVAIVVALAASWLLTRRLPIVPLITAVFVLFFGALTLIFQNDIFIKMKPTIVNCFFAAALLIGLFFGRSLLAYVFDSAFRLDDTGWRKLTFRWALFFIALAILNEIVWRNFSTDAWTSFKTFGILPLTVVFTLSQMPLISRHSLDEGGSP